MRWLWPLLGLMCVALSAPWLVLLSILRYPGAAEDEEAPWVP